MCLNHLYTPSRLNLDRIFHHNNDIMRCGYESPDDEKAHISQTFFERCKWNPPFFVRFADFAIVFLEFKRTIVLLTKPI